MIDHTREQDYKDIEGILKDPESDAHMRRAAGHSLDMINQQRKNPEIAKLRDKLARATRVGNQEEIAYFIHKLQRYDKLGT